MSSSRSIYAVSSTATIVTTSCSTSSLPSIVLAKYAIEASYTLSV